MDIQLTPAEQQLLVDTLTNHLAELRNEISNTDDYNLRQALKNDEATLKSLLGRLQQSKEAGI